MNNKYNPTTPKLFSAKEERTKKGFLLRHCRWCKRKTTTYWLYNYRCTYCKRDRETGKKLSAGVRMA